MLERLMELMFRLGGTMVVWIALAVILNSQTNSIHYLTGGQINSLFTFIIMLTVIFVALVSTLAIWDKTDLFLGRGNSSKRKNQDSTADAALMLLQLLSPEEQAAMRLRLMDRMRYDGELGQAGIFEERQDYEYYAQ